MPSSTGGEDKFYMSPPGQASERSERWTAFLRSCPGGNVKVFSCPPPGGRTNFLHVSPRGKTQLFQPPPRGRIVLFVLSPAGDR